MSRSTSRRRPSQQIAPAPARRLTAAFWVPPVAAIAALIAVTLLPSVAAQPGVVRAGYGAAGLLAAWLVGLILRVRAQGRLLTLTVQLRQQHYVQACAHASIYVYWGSYWGEVGNAVPLIAAQLAFAYAFDMLLTWSREDGYVLGFGPFPIIFSTNLFLWFKPEWFHLQFVMVAVGFAAKALIRWNRDGRRVHIFNPSSFALALFSIGLLVTGRSDITWGPEIAVTQLMPPHIYLLIFLVALPGQYLFGVASMTLAAVATTFIFTLSFFAVTGSHYFIEPSIPIAVFLGMHLLFTDPSTAPRTELGRLVFGVLYAASVIALYSLLIRAGLPGFYDKLLSVPILNLLVQVIDHAARSQTFASIDPGAWGRRLSPAARHLRYIGVWTVIFVLMLALTRDHVALARADIFAALNRSDEAIPQYQALLARRPEMPLVAGQLGLAQLRAGRPSEAAAALQRAAAAEPDRAELQTNLGLAYMQLGRIDEAATAFRRAVALDADNPESRYNLAQLLAEQGRARDAAHELRESLRLRPEWPTAMGALAWLQSTQPDFGGSTPEATVALAVRAAALTGHRDPAILDALGAAYAAAGDLAHAVHATGQALELARANAPGLAGGIRSRLEHYQTRIQLVNDTEEPHTAQP